MKLLSTTKSLGTDTILSPDIAECDEAVRHQVLAAVAKQRALVPGEVILYLEVILLPYPHIVNCFVTVKAGE